MPIEKILTPPCVPSPINLLSKLQLTETGPIHATKIQSCPLLSPNLALHMGLSHIPSCMRAQSFQSCPTPCKPMDCSPSGSSVHAIFQAKILECIAMPFSNSEIKPTSPALQVDYLSIEPPGNPPYSLICPPQTGYLFQQLVLIVNSVCFRDVIYSFTETLHDS